LDSQCSSNEVDFVQLSRPPSRRCIHTESLRRCRARKGLQLAWSSVAFPGLPEVRQPVRDELSITASVMFRCRARRGIDLQLTFGPMVQRTTTRALGARNRGSNPRRPTLPRWPSMVRHLPATEGSPQGSPRFESGSRRVPPGGAKRGSAELALLACGETCRQVTALGSKPRAARLRSSTLRLTVAVIIGGRIRTATTCPNDSGVRLSVGYSVGAWSNGTTPASRAGDGCSIRSAPIAAIPKRSTGHGRDPCVHRPSQVRILVAAYRRRCRDSVSRDWVVWPSPAGS
jgi:hypothetical protein